MKDTRSDRAGPGRPPPGGPQVSRVRRHRDDGRARIFHDLGRVEREGISLDTPYWRGLPWRWRTPVATEGIHFPLGVVPRRLVHPGVMRLIVEAAQRHRLTHLPGPPATRTA
jgi:ATP-dependent DNA helicase RecG